MAQQVTTLKKKNKSKVTQPRSQLASPGQVATQDAQATETKQMPQLARPKSQLKKNNATTQNALAATKPPRSQLAHPSHHPTPTRPSHHSLNMPNSTIPSDRKTLLQRLSQNACFRHVIRHAALRTLGPSSRAISLSPSLLMLWTGLVPRSFLLSLSFSLSLSSLSRSRSRSRAHTHAHLRKCPCYSLDD